MRMAAIYTRPARLRCRISCNTLASARLGSARYSTSGSTYRRRDVTDTDVTAEPSCSGGGRVRKPWESSEAIRRRRVTADSGTVQNIRGEHDVTTEVWDRRQRPEPAGGPHRAAPEARPSPMSGRVELTQRDTVTRDATHGATRDATLHRRLSVTIARHPEAIPGHGIHGQVTAQTAVVRVWVVPTRELQGL